LLGERQGQDAQLPWSFDSLPGAREGIGDLSFGYGLILAASIAIMAMALLSIGLDRLIYRPLRRRGSRPVIFIVASLGIAFGLRSIMVTVWGPVSRSFQGPGVIQRAREFPFGVLIKPDQIFIFAVALILAVLTYYLLFRTKLGKAMRAMSDNADLARVSGINPERIVMWTWVLAAILAGTAGVLLAIQTQLNPQLGFTLVLPLFAAVILGSIGNPLGALLGGLIVGLAQEVSVEFFAPDYKPGVAFVILILILLIRPQGLLGART